MPAGDVSDLKDVFDAIDRLCDTMKTSGYDESYDEPAVETCDPPLYHECGVELVSPEEVVIRTVETYRAERWSEPHPPAAATDEPHLSEDAPAADDTLTNPPANFPALYNPHPHQHAAGPAPEDSDTEPAPAPGEPVSEMYYTASSEVSLLSDVDGPERQIEDESSPDRENEESKECVIAGHVAAMREKFESMTRTNTPCPDSMRSTSPSLDVFRNVTPSPDDVLE